MMKRIAGIILMAILTLSVCIIFWVQPVAADEITQMQVSETMIELIKSKEGFCGVPCWDYRHWAIGFGNTCPEEDLERYRENGITLEEADRLMRDQLAGLVASVNSFMVRNQIQLTQNQFDAIVSFVYNVGPAVLKNDDSTVIKAIVNGAEGNDFIFAIGQWCLVDGEFHSNLMRRRMMEANIYLYGTYSLEIPDSYCVVKYDANGGTRDCRAQGYDSNMPTAPLSIPTREGYTFLGWFTEPTGGERVTALDETTNGITLYAQWELGKVEPDQPTDPETGIVVRVIRDDVYVRLAPGTASPIVTSVYKGEKLTITGLTEKGGILWGYSEKGWISLVHTDYFEQVDSDNNENGGDSETETVEVPIYATVLSSSGVKVYKGPHTSYPEIGSLSEGQQILIEETIYFCSQLWGRYEGGWVRLNQRILLHDDQVLAHTFTVTVTYYYLNVRTGPGSNYSTVMTMNTGEKLDIFAVEVVNGVVWGRFINGWVHLPKYTDFDESKLEYYQTHSYGDWYDTKAATCVENGQQRRDCAHCDHYELQETNLVEHSLGDWYESQAGTCISNGQERRDCQNCDYYEVNETELGDHSFDEWVTTLEGTCVVIGQECRNCVHCDHFETRDTALGDHAWMEWTQIQEPDCESVGQEQRNCENCEHFETREVEALGHSYDQWVETLAPGCESAGQEQRNCENCEHFETREVEAFGHSYGQWEETLAPGCESAGQEQRNCENCQHFETREVEALGHSYGQWVETLAPDCESAGQEQRNCENCEHFETREVEAVGHSFGEWYETVSPTAETEGEARRDCQNCDHYETKVLEKTLHIYGDWYVYTGASCVAAGEERRDCQHCELFESREIEMSDHTMGDWYLYQEATCVVRGEQRRECQNCDHYECAETELGDHSLGEWYVYQASTCATAGEERRECQNCDHYESRETAKGDHSLGQWHTHQEATCVAVGEERRICQHCDYFENREIPALGHNMGDWYVFRATSCTRLGVERRDCDRCSHNESRSIPKLNHSYGEWYVVLEPTIDDEGMECRDCQNCNADQSRPIPILPSVEKIYAIITASSVNVRENASASATKMGTLYEGAMVEILEQVTVKDKIWGRIEYGWIRLTGEAELATVREELIDDRGDKTYATVICDYLSVRLEPNGAATRVAKVWTGARVRIYETQVIGDVTWGKTAMGWIWLTGYTELSVELGDHLEHTFGDWYVYQQGTCVTYAQERRDCDRCEYFEVRQGQLGEHILGQWYTTQEPTCAIPGQERRDCQLCDHHELHATEPNGKHVLDAWYTVVNSTCQTEGQSRRDCQKCDYFETQSIPMLEHDMGQWYVVDIATCEHDGTQYRDCGDCDYSESKAIPALGHQLDQWYIAIESTCEVAGQERQKCRNCEYYESREIAPTGHAYGEWYVVRVPTLEQNGLECRDCVKCNTKDSRPITISTIVEKTYAVIIVSSINVRASESSSAERLGTLYEGAMVEILEQVTVRDKVWGRIEYGWICLTGETELITVREEIESDQGEKMFATVTCDYLSVRLEPNSTATRVAKIRTGARVRIYETMMIGDVTWGKTAMGWIWLTGYTEVEVEPGEHLEHSYGDWYLFQQGTDDAPAVERRDCDGCDHYETRKVNQSPAPVDKVYGIFTGTAYLNIREGAGTTYKGVDKLYPDRWVEILEMVDVDGKTWGRIEEGWICITGYISLSYNRTVLYATVTDSQLKIYERADSSATEVGNLNQGDAVEILEIVHVDGKKWGRIAQGWICLTDHTVLGTVN